MIIIIYIYVYFNHFLGMNTMQVMTAKEAKTKFGELIISVQREPVLITKNNKPIGAFVSLEDLKDTVIAEKLLGSYVGNEEWAKNRLKMALNDFDINGSSGVEATENFYDDIMAQVKQKLSSK